MPTVIPQTTLPNGMKISCLRKDEVQLMYQEVQMYLKHGIKLGEGDTVFDVGANIGLFTLLVAQHCNQNVNIYAFEPIPAIFQVLNSNVQRLALKSIKVFPWGLSQESKNMTFAYYPKITLGSTAYPITSQEELDKLKKMTLANFKNFPPAISWLRWLPKSLFSLIIDRKFATAFQAEQVICQLKTVSQMMSEQNIQQIDLLKIDVEKSEMDVLLGIENQDWPKIKQVFIEVHDLDHRIQKITALLQEQGFSEIKVEQEPILQGSDIFSLYAWRSPEK
ncbi:FkbM family methyltransferase [Calothrix sp. PCC 7507]|uniref:FkbM family methyltransferase n=1 Tax=Calothrix sp. PCC 7507 TaxID=99598 RepID=UPI00029F1CE9|nr:FkbM family methyltransferase [Calothrix sp. PCC 7507]AFY33077.1 methyltransferase FkbM family [Calothrix sp. PCC 7507]